MNFLHIHTTDIKGGAAITNYRFHKALLEKGYGSHILCGRKYSAGNDTAQVIPGGRIGWIFNAAAGKFFNDFYGLQAFAFPSSCFIRYSKMIKKWADVVILRNPHGWYLSLGILPWIAQNVPIIWRLPDMWGLTAHCAYSYDCLRWKTGCGRCPNLSEYPELYIDTTHFLWLRKKRIYQKIKNRLVLVSPSLWLKKLVSESPLLGDFRCEHIPTAVDLNIFKPGSKEEIRRSWNINPDEKVIVFSSFKFKHKRKGVDILLEVIKGLRHKIRSHLTLILLGQQGKEISFPQGVKVIRAGFINEDRVLANFYSVSDAYLSLSKMDNLPNALIESAACGLPIVTLDNGGCREAVEDTRSGYIVKDVNTAVEALEDILSDNEKRADFSLNARKFAESNFGMDAQVAKYVALAKEILA